MSRPRIAEKILLVAMLEKFTQSLMPLFEDYRQLALQVREDMPKVAPRRGTQSRQRLAD